MCRSTRTMESNLKLLGRKNKHATSSGTDSLTLRHITAA